MQYRQQGTADDLAQSQSGRSGVGAESLHQSAREFDREGHLCIADRDRTFELVCLLEIAQSAVQWVQDPLVLYQVRSELLTYV